MDSNKAKCNKCNKMRIILYLFTKIFIILESFQNSCRNFDNRKLLNYPIYSVQAINGRSKIRAFIYIASFMTDIFVFTERLLNSAS